MVPNFGGAYILWFLPSNFDEPTTLCLIYGYIYMLYQLLRQLKFKSLLQIKAITAKLYLINTYSFYCMYMYIYIVYTCLYNMIACLSPAQGSSAFFFEISCLP